MEECWFPVFKGQRVQGGDCYTRCKNQNKKNIFFNVTYYEVLINIITLLYFVALDQRI